MQARREWSEIFEVLGEKNSVNLEFCTLWNYHSEVKERTSLVAQWLRIHLPTQGTRIWPLVQEDPTCCGATKSVHHNYWACALESASHNYWACMPQLLKPACPRACTPQLQIPCAATTEARAPRARALQQEKPPQWEARAPQWRVAPARCP